MLRLCKRCFVEVDVPYEMLDGFSIITVNCKFALVRVESLVCPPKEIKFVSLIKLVKQNPNFHVPVYTHAPALG